MPSHRSSLSKSIVWRIMGVFVLGAVTYFFTRHWVITTAIALVHHTTFIVVFYLHERAWLKVGLQGRVRNVAKAFVYEIILGMGIGGLIVLLFTGQWSQVTRITTTYTAIKLVMYYVYDRAWK